MKNLKKTLALVAALAMAGTMFTACGKTEDSSSSAAETTKAGETTKVDETTTAKELAPDTGKTVKIYTWNEEFKQRLRRFYPEYDATKSGYDDKTQKVGAKEYLKNGLEIEWVTTPNQNNAYQNKLDADLKAASTSDPIDMFLIEADYALKYCNSDYSMDVKELGLTDADMADMYQYTKDIVTVDGKLKGVTWQATPGLFAYRRTFAKDVLGSDDPAEVQKAVADWSTFDATAEKAKAKGLFMISGYDDSFRVFANNVTAPWVDADKNVKIDENIMKWVDQTKTYTDKGYNNKTSLWNDAWTKGQGPNGKVFGYFYSTWGINFTLMGNSLADPNGEKKVGNGCYGDWAVCAGPQAWYWGGTWLCAAKGTDNPNAVASIMKSMTCDPTVMKKITEVEQDYTNNKKAMEEIGSSDFKSEFLGGQNHIALFVEAAPKIDMSKAGAYDQGCTEEIMKAMKDYFDGKVDKDTAVANFYKAIKVKYPSLKTPQ